MARTQPAIAIGDKVTTKCAVEALYSGMYAGTASAYPEQWFEVGMIGTVVGVDSPAVRRNVLQCVVTFISTTPIFTHRGQPNYTWRARLDPKDIERL